MLEKFKSELEETRVFLEDVVEKIEDQAEDITDDSQALWQKTKAKINEVKVKLAGASKKLHENTDEARLQAHLAVMEAHDQWSVLQHNVTAFNHQLENKTKPIIDHAQIQAHLAKLEATDFMAGPGQELVKQFAVSKEKVEKASLKAIQSIKEYYRS